MRVAILTNHLAYLSGTEASFVTTCTLLRRAGDDVRAFCNCSDGLVHPHWKNTLLAAGVPLIEHETSRQMEDDSDKAFCHIIAEYLCEWPPDLIHAIPLAPLGLAWLKLNLLPTVPVVGSEMSEASPRCFWYDPTTFEDYRKYDALIASCETVRTGISTYFGFSKRVEVIPPLVAVQPDEMTPISQHELPRVNDLGSITRLRLEKGPEFLIATLALLVRSRRDVTLTIYGEAPEIERTSQLARSLGVENRLFIAGPFEGPSGIEGVARRHCIFLLSSLFEGLPLSILELMARGRIVVATDVGGIAEAFDSTTAGCVVPPGDPRAMAEAVLRLLDDPSGLVKRGLSGIEKYKERYSANVVVDSLKTFYAELIGGQV